MDKRLALPGCILWIVGLTAFIVGLNIHNDTGEWISIIGSVLFLIGLGIVGAARMMMWKNENRNNQEE